VVHPLPVAHVFVQDNVDALKEEKKKKRKRSSLSSNKTFQLKSQPTKAPWELQQFQPLLHLQQLFMGWLQGKL